MNPAAFRKLVEADRIPAVSFFVGTDEYLCRDLIEQVKTKVFPHPDPLAAMESWDGREHALADILASAQQLSFGCPRKMLVIRNADSLLSEEELLPSYLESPAPAAVLIFCLGKLDMRRKCSKAIEEFCTVVALQDPYTNQHETEVQRLLKSFQQLSFSEEALACLRDWVCDDLGALKQELEKISLAFPDKSPIETTDIEGIVFRQETQNIFDLADAIALQDRKTALELLIRLMREGKSALEVFGLLRAQARKLYQAAELLAQGKSPRVVCQTLRVPPYFSGAFVAKAKRAKAIHPARFFALLLEHEKAIKTGLWREGLAAELLVVKLCA